MSTANNPQEPAALGSAYSWLARRARAAIRSGPGFAIEVAIFWLALEAFQQLNYGGRIVTGPQFALREAAAAQMIYLVLFSVAFFFRGFTGLAITIGSILTLFAVMQMTARIRWAERFSGAIPPGLPRISEELQA